MHRIRGGIIYKMIPDKPTKHLPGFSTPNMTVRGIVVHDSLENAQTIIGGSVLKKPKFVTHPQRIPNEKFLMISQA